MALFGGLFNKKNCAICGGDIGLMGNRKLEDGNLCKHCAAKLSPWFSERRHSTVAQIADQLQYREDNRGRVAAFHMSRSYGYHTRLIIDDDHGVFMVTSSDNWMRDNPDVIDYGFVTGCQAMIHEDRREVRHRGPDGHEVPFQPPRFVFDYDFSILLHLNHPWFDEIRFTLRNNVPGDDRVACDELIATAEDIVETMTGVRPNLAPQVPYHPPFCRECGRDLPMHGGPCPFCSRPMPRPEEARFDPRPMPGPAPMPVKPEVRAAEMPLRPGMAPAPHPVQPHAAPVPQQPVNRGPGAPMPNADRGPAPMQPGRGPVTQPPVNRGAAPQPAGDRGPGPNVSQRPGPVIPGPRGNNGRG